MDSSPYEETIKELIQQITAAFASVEYPGDENIADPQWDEGTTAYFAGKGQTGHTAEILRQYEGSLFFFQPAAFLYFLPAYLVATLEDPERADVIPDTLFGIFASAKQRAPLVALMTHEQRAVLAKFFQFLIDCDNNVNDDYHKSAVEALSLTQ